MPVKLQRTWRRGSDLPWARSLPRVGPRVWNRKTEFSSLKKRRMALVTGTLSCGLSSTTSTKHLCSTSRRLYFRAGYLKSKLMKRLVDHVGQEQGAALAEGRLLPAAVTGHGGRGDEVDQDLDQQVEVRLQTHVDVEEEGLQGQQQQSLLGEAVEDGFVLVRRRGVG